MQDLDEDGADMTLMGTISGGLGLETANQNQFIIRGGEVKGNIVGGYSLKEAHNNTVSVEAGSVTGSFIGGVAEAKEESLGDQYTSMSVNSNDVKIASGVTTDPALEVYGGMAIVNRSNVTKVSVEDNRVTLGAVKVGNVYGSVVSISPDSKAEIQAFATIELNGTTVKEDVAAVYVFESSGEESAALMLADETSTLAAARTSERMVTVGESAIKLTNVTVGGTVGGVSGATGSSNKTSVEVTGVNSVGGISDDVSKITFNVGTANKEAAVLTLTNEETELEDVTMVVNGLDAEAADGKLIATKNGAKATFSGTMTYAGTFESATKTLDGTTIDESNPLTAEAVTKAEDAVKSLNGNAKTLAESLLGSVALINQGAEFMASEGLAAINAAASSDSVTAFGAVSAGSTRYETGSHVDLTGGSYVFGAATKVGSVTFAGYGEIGYAESEAHVKNTKADGEHTYYGVGIAARYDFEVPFYVEGSVRVGQAKTEFDGYYGSNNAKAKYDAKSVYTSAHIGVGYVFDLADSVKLDTYGRYLYTYLGSDKVTLTNPERDHLKLDATSTQTVQLGVKLTGAITENAFWKVGAAYEHVFGGDADSWLNGQKIVSPSVSGNSGILEAGASVKPSSGLPWKFDFGVKGYVGDRQGATGFAQVQYLF